VSGAGFEACGVSGAEFDEAAISVEIITSIFGNCLTFEEGSEE
jgi:hypothetical protein